MNAPTEEGFSAQALWEMRRHSWTHNTPHGVTIDKLFMAHALQVRETPLERGYVDELMQLYAMGEQLDPIMVAKIVAPEVTPSDAHPVDTLTPGGFFVVDGFHRLQAQLDLERRTGAHLRKPRKRVLCRVMSVTPREALAMAAFANATHGRPLERQERHHLLGAFLANGFHHNPDGSVMSSREIHAALKVPETDRTIRKWLKNHYPTYLAELKQAHGQWDGEEDDKVSPEDRQRIAALKRRKEVLNAMGKTLADVVRHRLELPDLRLLEAHTRKLLSATESELRKLGVGKGTR
jgi:hypothetical protein